jgi:outer membrane protein assembly factor BamB
MRRIVLGLAGLLSLLAGGLLAAVWFDDGTVVRRGPAVLAGAEELAEHVPGLGWTRTAAVLGVLAVLTAVGALASRTRAAALWAAAVGALAAAATGLAAANLAAATPAVPREAVLLAAATVTWALAAWVTPGRPADPRLAGPGGPSRPGPAERRPADPHPAGEGGPGAERAVEPGSGRGRGAVVAAAVVAVVAAVVAGVGGPWWAYGRLVDRTTTVAAVPADDPAGPAAPGGVRWSRAAAGSVALGRYVALREAGGNHPRVVVVDAATGTERWSYRHRAAGVQLAGDPASGVLLLGLDRDGARELRAFDLPTGRPLWDRRDGGEPLGDDGRFDSDGVVAPAGVLLLLDRRATRLRALDPRTGARRWERAVDPECAASAGLARAGDVLVLTSLCERTTVPAYRLDTGADAWTVTVADRPVRSRGSLRPPLVAGGTVGLLVGGDTYTLVGVDAATGAVRWRRPAPPGVLPATVTAGRFVLAELDRAGRLAAVAVDPATGRAAWTTVLPRQPRRTGDEELVAGTDGTRWYLLAGVFPGGPGTTWLTVLDGAGRPLGVGELAGCPAACAGGQILPADSATIAGAGGTLVVLPGAFGLDRQVVGVGPGPAFRPAP